MDHKRRRNAAATAHDGESSDDEQYEVATPPARATARRAQGRIDFSKLEANSLKRYRKVYKLPEPAPGSTKEDLIPAVARHFAAQIVDEMETLRSFAATLKKQAGTDSTIFVPAAAKKPRGGGAKR